jgi:hypothetical protein
MRLTAAERERLGQCARDPDGFERGAAKFEADRVTDRRLWAAVMLTASVDVCRSIVGGNRVLARQLDAEAFRRALRGRRPSLNPQLRRSGSSPLTSSMNRSASSRRMNTSSASPGGKSGERAPSSLS